MGLLDKLGLRLRSGNARALAGAGTIPAVTVGQGAVVYTKAWTGELTPGELGPATRYVPNYQMLRLRSWQALEENPLIQIALNTYVTWLIGSGCKIEPEPKAEILRMYGLEVNDAELRRFKQQINALFNLRAESRHSDYSGQGDLHTQAKYALINAIVGGDCVVAYHVEKKRIAVEVIDGELVVQPVAALVQEAEARGNKVELGVEYQPDTLEHVAYYVVQRDGSFKRLACYGKKSGRLLATMWHGSKQRCNELRGKPIFSAMLEMAKKMGRYQDAAVGTAEERQKFVAFFEHNQYSTGENPMQASVRGAEQYGLPPAGEQGGYSDKDGVQYAAPPEVAHKIAMTTNKQIVNMPVGAKVHMPEFKSDINFADFYETNGKFFYAALEIPYEIAMMMFTSSFSSSRAAAKIWDHTLYVKSKPIRENFYQPYYNLLLEIAVGQGLLRAEGLLQAYAQENYDVIDAYNTMRLIPTKMPHIDPAKEAMAERIKLGDPSKGQLPLISHDRATENLNEGDWVENHEKFQEELKLSSRLTALPVEA